MSPVTGNKEVTNQINEREKGGTVWSRNEDETLQVLANTTQFNWVEIAKSRQES